MAKVARNQERDQEVWRKLEAKGWSVIIVWECQLKKANLEETIKRVADEIVRNGEVYRATQEERKKSAGRVSAGEKRAEGKRTISLEGGEIPLTFFPSISTNRRESPHTC